MKIVSHRSAPQNKEGMNDFSVFCGALSDYLSVWKPL